MSSYDMPKEIIGHTILTVEVATDGQSVTLALADGKAVFHVYGDCCSSSWIEHATVPPDIAGAVITGFKSSGRVENEDEIVAAWEKDNPYEYLKVYQDAVVTNRGEIVFEYRNSSNGYYGGWMSGSFIPQVPA